MSDFIFFLKILAITFVVVLLLQIRFGEKTAEDYTMDFLTSSAVVKPINQTAGGAVIFIRNMWSKFSRSINTKFINAMRSENQPGSRQSHFMVERSKELKEAKENTAELMERFKQRATATTKKIRSKFID